MAARPVAQLVADVAAALLGRPLPLGLRCWDGSRVAGPPGSPWLVLRNPRALRRIILGGGELGLARAYVSGDLDIEGSLYDALEIRKALPDDQPLRLDRRALRPLLRQLVRAGVLGWPPRRPAEESRLRGWRHSPRRDRAAISHHYDVGNDFYALLLGPSMVYSCAYFAEPSTTLEEAQEAKLELVCRKLALRPGMRLLDIGCGWGSLVLHAATAHGARCVGVTISTEQAHLARRRVREAGLDQQVEIRLQDYRDVRDGPYDAIASVGMAEHVGRAQLPTYAAGLHELLAPGGRLLHHAIARGPDAGPDRPDPRSFLTRYVFPDGELQPLSDHVAFLEGAGLEVRDVEGLRAHYALTCRAWVNNLENRWDEAVGLASPGRARVWRLYLAGSALAFEARRVGVNQLLATRAGGTGPHATPPHATPWPLRRPDWSGPGSSLPPTSP
jgi:cyclopropane-fatty-acyl-phospholipid synthase